jgi:Flp pilus assembly protein TadB
VYFLILFLWAVAITLVVIAVFTIPKPVSIKPMLAPEEVEQLKRMQRHSIVAMVFPFTRGLLSKFNLAGGLKQKLEASHTHLTAHEFFNIKMVLTVLLGVSTIVLFHRVDPLLLVPALGLGYILPDLWLKKKLNRRKDEIASLLPEVVDILGLCVEAGLDFITSIQWIIEKTPDKNPVIEELAFLLEEIRWGKQRSQALKDMSKRLDIPEVRLFVSTLVQAERMGTPMGDALAIISEDTRLQRFHRGERKALRAPILILIPLIFCILPVIAIIVAGPILLQFIEGQLFQIPG